MNAHQDGTPCTWGVNINGQNNWHCPVCCPKDCFCQGPECDDCGGRDDVREYVDPWGGETRYQCDECSAAALERLIPH